MQALLTLNAGSSSLKASLFSMNTASMHLILSLQFSHIGGNNPSWLVKDLHGKIILHEELDLHAVDATDRHLHCLQRLLQWLSSHYPHIDCVASAHRIVHGGELFTHPVRICPAVIAALESLIPLAPLHQPYNLKLVSAVHTLLPDIPAVACFDTTFHCTQPSVQRLYALPKHLSAAGILKYGFHGLSYEFIATELERIQSSALKTLVCHLGAGASICAMQDGKSVASSMGFTALDGLPMGSRCGNLDPGVILYLLREQNLSINELEHLLYQESGWLGVSGGISADMLTLKHSTHADARLAIEHFCMRTAEEIGRLAASLQGIEQIVFTGGVGEHDADVRANIIQRCHWLGAQLDATQNQQHATLISSAQSAIKIRVIATDEEKMLALHADRLLNAAV